jgi:uncharacterized repeat protein (TIGR01451 family)
VDVQSICTETGLRVSVGLSAHVIVYGLGNAITSDHDTGNQKIVFVLPNGHYTWTAVPPAGRYILGQSSGTIDDSLCAIPVTPTATLTALPLPTPGSPPSSVCALGNLPTITITVDRRQKLPGELVVFTATVKNPHQNVLSGVIVTETLSSLIEYQGATATKGQPVYDSQTRVVTLDIGTLAAGQSVVLVVTGRVSAQAKALNQVTSITQVCQAGGCCSTAGATANVIPAGIPVTGDGPGGQEISVILLAALGAAMVMLSGVGAVVRHGRRRR